MTKQHSTHTGSILLCDLHSTHQCLLFLPQLQPLLHSAAEEWGDYRKQRLGMSAKTLQKMSYQLQLTL